MEDIIGCAGYQDENKSQTQMDACILSLEQVMAEDESILFYALDYYHQGMDFADDIHLASSSRATSFATFDAKFRSRANKLSLIPTVILP